MSKKDKKCITLLFSGNITRRRIAHIMKFLEILSPWATHINIIATRIEKEALKDFITYINKIFPDKSNKLRFIVLEPAFVPTKKSLLKDVVISFAQLPRIHEHLKCDTLIVAGTINLANILIPRFIKPKTKIMIFAGGFSYMGINIDTLKNTIKKYLIYLIEFVHMLLANRILIEAQTMRNYIPFSKLINSVFKNKIIDYANLHVEEFFFHECKDSKNRFYDLGYIGALEERRYIKELLLLIKYLPKFINKKVRVLIIGDGPLKDVVENFVKKLENRNSMIINYIPSVPHFQLKDYYNEIKVMILLSKCDGLPNTIIEAMACCCVVISTPVGGIPSVIDDNVTGFIVNGDNIILETSLLLKKLLNNDEIIKRIGITAMQRVFKSFSVVPVRIKWKYILDQ